MTSPLKPELHIASAFDSNYVTPFFVLLTSIFYHNKNSKVIIHSIATGVKEQDKHEIKNFVLKHEGEIYFYAIDEEYVRNHVVIPVNNYFTIATYYRLFLPSLLPHSIEKLLYIDTDAIVVDNLTELYQTNAGDVPFAAVPDPYPEVRPDLGITEEGNYFNAGVLLINMESWRKNNVTERAMQFVIDYPDRIKWVDQDALNAIQKDNWYKLDQKYNFTWWDVWLQIPAKLLAKDKVIIHYTTANKPWNLLARNKLRYLYKYYFKMSPRAHESLYWDKKWDLHTLKTYSRIRFKEFYFNSRLDKFLPVKSWLTAGKQY